MQPEVLAAIISAITALAAVIVSPFLAYRAGKRQMIGPMRQTWINDLRNTLTEYMAILSINRWHGAPSAQDPPADQERKELEDLGRVKEAIRLREKIFLLLNPTEAPHIELSRLVQSAFDIYNRGDDAAASLVAIRTHSQSVLKAEWEVVKQ
ncbi:hypothetical protein [Thermomonas brevis]